MFTTNVTIVQCDAASQQIKHNHFLFLDTNIVNCFFNVQWTIPSLVKDAKDSAQAVHDCFSQMKGKHSKKF